MSVQEAPLRRTAAAAVAIALLAFGVRLGWQLATETSAPVDLTRLPELDTHTFHETAVRIAGGDPLLRDVYHPYHWWYRRIASEEEFRSFYRRGVYHQSPLYPYLIAAVYAAAGDDPRAVHRLQAILGAVTAALVFLLARRVAPPPGAAAAGLLFALYAPAVFYDGVLLRASLVTFLAAALLLACVRVQERAGRWLAWLAVGVLIALSALAKPTILAFAPVILAWLAWSARGRRSGPLVGPGVALAGMLLALSPLLARNVAVGAPPFAISTRGPYAFVNGNAQGSTGVGWFPPETRATLLDGHAREILPEARGRLLPTVARTLATHRDEPFGYVRLLAAKAGALLGAYEVPNNVDFHAFQRALPWLRFLPTFWILAPLAVIGLLGAPRRPLAPVLLYLAASFAVTVAFFVVARFRLPMIPAVAVLSGLGVSRLVEAVRRGRWLRLGAALLAAGLVLLVVRPGGSLPSQAAARVRVGDYLMAMGDLERAESWYGLAAEGAGPVGDRVVALSRLTLARQRQGRSVVGVSRTLRDLLGEDLGDGERARVHLALGSLYYATGQLLDARGELELAAELAPEDPAVMLSLALVCSITDQRDRAVALARRSLELDPEQVQAYLFLGEHEVQEGDPREGRRLLERALAIGVVDPATEARVHDLLRRAEEAP